MKVAISIIIFAILVGTSLTQTQPPTQKRAWDPDLNPHQYQPPAKRRMPSNPNIDLGFHNLRFKQEARQIDGKYNSY